MSAPITEAPRRINRDRLPGGIARLAERQTASSEAVRAELIPTVRAEANLQEAAKGAFDAAINLFKKGPAFSTKETDGRITVQSELAQIDDRTSLVVRGNFPNSSKYGSSNEAEYDPSKSDYNAEISVVMVTSPLTEREMEGLDEHQRAQALTIESVIYKINRGQDREDGSARMLIDDQLRLLPAELVDEQTTELQADGAADLSVEQPDLLAEVEDPNGPVVRRGRMTNQMNDMRDMIDYIDSILNPKLEIEATPDEPLAVAAAAN